MGAALAETRVVKRTPSPHVPIQVSTLRCVRSHCDRQGTTAWRRFALRGHSNCCETTMRLRVHLRRIYSAANPRAKQGVAAHPDRTYIQPIVFRRSRRFLDLPLHKRVGSYREKLACRGQLAAAVETAPRPRRRLHPQKCFASAYPRTLMWDSLNIPSEEKPAVTQTRSTPFSRKCASMMSESRLRLKTVLCGGRISTGIGRAGAPS